MESNCQITTDSDKQGKEITLFNVIISAKLIKKKRFKIIFSLKND